MYWIYMLGWNVIWGAFCFLEKSKTTHLFLSERTSFEIFEIWLAGAIVVSFFIFAVSPKKDKKVEKYTCPHCGAEFKGGLKPTFCQVCKAAIEQPKIDKNSRYYKKELNSK